jgi:hypothetical protein
MLWLDSVGQDDPNMKQQLNKIKEMFDVKDVENLRWRELW